jgi:beta-N-acetylhexosaminidase
MDHRIAEITRAVRGVLLPGFTGTEPPPWLADAVRDGLAGVVLFAQNTPDVVTTAALTSRLHALDPGLLVATDEEGGDVSRLEAVEGSSRARAAPPGGGGEGRGTHACSRRRASTSTSRRCSTSTPRATP